MRAFLVPALAGVFLSACTQTAGLDETLRRELPRVCSVATTAHTAFLAVSVSGRLSQATIGKEARLWASVGAVCADPANATVTSTLIAAATGYAAFALTEVEKMEKVR